MQNSYWFMTFFNQKLASTSNNLMNLRYWKLYGWHWAIPDKKQTGGVKGILFWKTSMKFLGFLIYPWKSQQKQSFNLKTSQNSVTLLKAKNQYTYKFHKIFSWSPLEIPISISSILLEIKYPEPSLSFFFFSGIAHFKNEVI